MHIHTYTYIHISYGWSTYCMVVSLLWLKLVATPPSHSTRGPAKSVLGVRWRTRHTFLLIINFCKLNIIRMDLYCIQLNPNSHIRIYAPSTKLQYVYISSDNIQIINFIYIKCIILDNPFYSLHYLLYTPTPIFVTNKRTWLVSLYTDSHFNNDIYNT